MATTAERIANAIFGDPALEGLQQHVTSYEDVHAEVQSILIPTIARQGITVRVLQPLNKKFALSHRLAVVSHGWHG